MEDGLLVNECAASLAREDIRTLARVQESERATDLIVLDSRGRFAVIRCAARGSHQDHTELATMIAQGDFVWAGLVYDGEDEAGPFSPIESFHVSELDRLVERLREVGERFDETR